MFRYFPEKMSREKEKEEEKLSEDKNCLLEVKKEIKLIEEELKKTSLKHVNYNKLIQKRIKLRGKIEHLEEKEETDREDTRSKFENWCLNLLFSRPKPWTLP